MNDILTSSYRNLFVAGLFVYLITAYFSIGFYHPDEHFQILEFCNYKLGNSPASELPWEFHEKIRPAIQPAILWLLEKGFYTIGISNPFTAMLFLRILTALLSWYVISKTCLILLHRFSTENGKHIFLLLSLFLWFIPSLSVRYSSENYAALFFNAAIYLILIWNNQNTTVSKSGIASIGFLLGLAFFFRFQMAFAILGIGFWLLIIQKPKWNHLILIALSALLSMLLCIYIDYWFYGTFTFTPLNYFQVNILENKAANWGVFPWWFYLREFILKAIPPISIFLLVFFVCDLFKNRKSIYSWAIIPFLLAHFWVGHKELRFLFPMVFPFIYLVSYGIDSALSLGNFQKTFRVIYFILAGINLPLLVFKMFTPAQEAVCYYQFLYNYSSTHQMNLICEEKDVYNLIGLNLNFYKSANINCIVLKDQQEISNYLQKTNPDSIYLLKRELSSANQFAHYDSQKIYCMLPDWLLYYNVNNWQNRARIWKIEMLRRSKAQ